MFKTLIILIFSINIAHADFEKWKVQYANRAVKRGLKKDFVLKELKSVKFDPEVVKKDRNQIILDNEKDYQAFIKRWLKQDPTRVEVGKQKLKEHSKLLRKIEKKYGVDKEVIVALWGTETFYGKITGDYDIVSSLATLSYDGRRSSFFEKQLNAALRLIQQGHVQRKNLKGSWAGATGHCQFMPSNIPVYAQDFNGDGKKDIWNTHADIFASIANYLSKNGWKKGKSIGSLAVNTKNKKLSFDKYRSKSEYNKLGFRHINGKKISGNWSRRKMAEIPMKNSPVILRGSNYTPLLKWNRSSLFAAFNILLVNGFRGE